MKKYMRNLKKAAGLSLLELMVSVAVLSILLTAVGPNIQSILVTNRITADVNTLSSVMRFARHTAVNEQTNVTICATTDFNKCVTDWDASKMVFIDADGNDERGAAEELLASGDPTASTNTLSGINAEIVFEADGSLTNGNALTLKFCPTSNDDEFARALVVTAFGRMSVGAQDASGTSLTCP